MINNIHQPVSMSEKTNKKGNNKLLAHSFSEREKRHFTVSHWNRKGSELYVARSEIPTLCGTREVRVAFKPGTRVWPKAHRGLMRVEAFSHPNLGDFTIHNLLKEVLLSWLPKTLCISMRERLIFIKKTEK